MCGLWHVMNLDYSMIINRYPSEFFKARWGLREGCLPSLLLFILAMDGLSLHISHVVERDQFQALEIGYNINISHGFFVEMC